MLYSISKIHKTGIHTVLRKITTLIVVILVIFPGTLLPALILARIFSRYVIYDSTCNNAEYSFVEHNGMRNYYLTTLDIASSDRNHTTKLSQALVNKNIIIYLHGRSMNASDDYSFYSSIATSNCEVFALEYPGYGGIEGKSSAPIIRKSIHNFFDFLEQECKVSSNNIIVCGHSLGAMYGISVINQREKRYGHTYAGFIGLAACLCLVDSIVYAAKTEFLCLNIIGFALHSLINVALPPKEKMDATQDYREMKTKAYFLHGEEDSVTPHKAIFQIVNRNIEIKKSMDFVKIIPSLPHNPHTSILYLMKDSVGRIVSKITIDTSSAACDVREK